jgi:hypothetical protein
VPDGLLPYAGNGARPMVAWSRETIMQLLAARLPAYRSVRSRVPIIPCETTDSRPRHGLHEVMMMSNPWLKKNPYMSMWLSGANSLANTARGKVAGHAKRQSTAALNKASRDIFSLWTDALTAPLKPAKPVRRKKR